MHQSEEVRKFWKPKVGEGYWYIEKDGTNGSPTYVNDDIDRHILKQGNYYKTKEETEFFSKQQKYTNLYRKYVEEHSEPLNFCDGSQIKYAAYYDFEDKKIDFLNYVHAKSQGVIYANDEEILKEAIAFVGEDNFKNYVLGLAQPKAEE